MTASDAPDVPDLAADLPGRGRMPLLGFGTWQLRGDEARRAVACALEAGYRHLDTATVYRNEAEVGAALRDSGLDRDAVFLTTKIPPDRAGDARATIEASLAALGVDQVDLWLVHWPPDDGAGTALWEAVVRAREDGLTRHVGVSNYSLDQLDALTRATGVTPAVNQVPWSPSRFDRQVLDGSRERGVVLEGYSPFRAGGLDDPTLVEVAERLGRTPAQVVVRWHLQHGVVVIPKSAHDERIRANADVGGFTLGDADMAAIDALGGTAGDTAG